MPALVEAVESGRQPEIILARNSRPAARLVPIARKKPIRLGLANGQFSVPDDWAGMTIWSHRSSALASRSRPKVRVKLLLDTHLGLWAVSDVDRLTMAERRAIDGADEIIVSVSAIWEISIKYALRRRRTDPIVLSGRAAQAQFGAAGFTIFSINADHAAAIDNLPLAER